jgi:hypothetical protein
MNELQWLNQTRMLKRPVEPSHELWPEIAARLTPHTRSARSPRSRWLPWAMAATLAAVSVFAGTLVWQQHANQATHLAAHVAPTAVTPWKPRDPHLVGAAIELNVARDQLARAIHDAPDDTYLRDMLAHANAQVRRLKQLPQRAG